MSQLTTLASVKAMANIAPTDTSKDYQYTALISAISSAVQNSIHRNLALQSYTDYYSPTGDAILQLRNFPIATVTRVCVDPNGNFGETSGAFPSSLDLVQGVDYSIMAGRDGIGSSGCLRRINGYWYKYKTWAPGKVAPQVSADNGSILVQYTAGYSPIPAAIALAVNQAIIDAGNRMVDGGPVSSESYQNASMSFFGPDQLLKVFGSIQSTLSFYRVPSV